MIFIIDSRAPLKAKKKLFKFGDIIELKPSDAGYEAISGHPDIFSCKIGNKLIVAPNSPIEFLELLNKRRICFILGEKSIGTKYPETSSYNAAVSDNYIIHNFKHTDKTILHHCVGKKIINAGQGYSRCNAVPLMNDAFIVSDKGILKALLKHNLAALYVNSEDIVLPGVKNGFFGGTCGTYEDYFFIAGSLNKYSYGKQARSFLNELGYNIIELTDEPLFDCGSLIVI